MLLDAAKSFLLLVDMQERLLPAMGGGAEVERRCAILLTAAKRLAVPVLASEQYPKGLGHTVSSLGESLGNAPIFEKTSFSCWRDDALKSHLVAHHEAGRPQAIVAGIEAHVCVLQTAIDLAQAGFAVFAVADAMASRAPASAVLAQDRMRGAGVAVINTEMAVFELLGRAGTAEFRELSALIR
ncbi:MAG: hydrolase [Rhizobiales bacterium]|nr:hydrolase [Hyphomicrobiales bacterium]MBI3673722.1 hydrolase [Hyphomicrobiales bacterium]